LISVSLSADILPKKDPQKVAELLNTHFGTIGEKMASKFTQPESDEIRPTKNPLDYINADHLNSDENKLKNLKKVSKDELQRLIISLDVKKSSGYDCISNFMIKKTCDVIVPHLVTLYNACLKQGVFPDNYKIAKVIPLFKGGDRENVNNYRPISLLPAFGKLFEKLFFLFFSIYKFRSKGFVSLI